VAAYYLTAPTSIPASSMTSLRTASSNDSPGSMNPARQEYMPKMTSQLCHKGTGKAAVSPLGHLFCLPSSILSPASFRMPMMIT